MSRFSILDLIHHLGSLLIHLALASSPQEGSLGYLARHIAILGLEIIPMSFAISSQCPIKDAPTCQATSLRSLLQYCVILKAPSVSYPASSSHPFVRNDPPTFLEASLRKKQFSHLSQRCPPLNPSTLLYTDLICRYFLSSVPLLAY